VPLLIVNADDLGLTEGINQGIFEAHACGVVTSASLMVEGPAAGSAVNTLEAYPNLSIGLHFVQDSPAILDERDALAAAFAAQLDRFRRLLGREPTHVDSHHHVHMSRLSAFRSVTRPLGVPLRGDGRVLYLDGFYAENDDVAPISRARLLELLDAHRDAAAVELGCHPGRVTDELTSSYRKPRQIELGTLTAPGLRDELSRAGYELVSFVAARALASTYAAQT
jgi:chitin disaccharide deacetylase